MLTTAVACGGGMRAPSIAPASDDAAVTARVRTALLNEPGVHAGEINVSAQGGVVVLAGQVHGDNEANAAVGAARRVAGVRDVRSELKPTR